MNNQTIRELLSTRNNSLARDFELLAAAMARANVPHALKPYQERLKEECEHWIKVIARNLKRLKLQQDTILEDVLSDTQQATKYCRLISERMATPVLRSDDQDSLALHLLREANKKNINPRQVIFNS